MDGKRVDGCAAVGFAKEFIGGGAPPLSLLLQFLPGLCPPPTAVSAWSQPTQTQKNISCFPPLRRIYALLQNLLKYQPPACPRSPAKPRVATTPSFKI